MASTYSTRLKTELIGDGEQSNTWGTTTNNNFGNIFDESISNVYTKTLSGSGTTALTWNNGPVAAASNEVRQAGIKFAGHNGAQIIQIPAVDPSASTAICTQRIIYVINEPTASPTGAETIQLQCGTSGNKSSIIPAKGRALLATDGTNWYELSGSGGGATASWRTVTATGNVYAGEKIFVNHSGAVTLSLPDTSTVGTEIRFLDVSSAGAGTNTITIDTVGSNTVLGGASTTVSTTGAGFSLVLFSTDWKLMEK